MKRSPSTPARRLISGRLAAQHLGRTYRYLATPASRAALGLRCYRVGGRVLYDLADLDALLARAAERPTPAEPRAPRATRP